MQGFTVSALNDRNVALVLKGNRFDFSKKH